MNELTIPPAPVWYKNLAMACAPDSTLVYGSKNDIVVIKESGSEQPAQIKLIQTAHSKYVISISLNKKWGNPNSYAVSLGEDNIIKVWNLDSLEQKYSNNDHVKHQNPVVGAVFAGDDRIVSAASNGFIIVWNININESKPLKDLFNDKVTLTSLSSCPHAGWLLAFGLNNGCVIVADLRRNGQVLYKLRGHYQAVVSLSWCPAPVNIFPRHTQNVVKNKTLESINKDVEAKESSEIKNDIKPNPWVNLVHSDDNEILPEIPNPVVESVNDFLKECDELKSKIMKLEVSTVTNGDQRESSTLENSSTSNSCVQEVCRDLEAYCNETHDSTLDTNLVNNEDISSNHNELSVICEQEEKSIEEPKDNKLDNSRPLPSIFDPSGDFVDDLVYDSTLVKEDILEDEDVGDEINDDKSTTNGDKDENNKNTDTFSHEEDSKVMTEEFASVQTEIIEEEPRTEYLLASSGKDRTVYIWRAGTDGRMQTFFHIPKRTKRKEQKGANAWIALCWITPNTLLTSAATGEILAWQLPKPKELNKQYKVVHYEHSSVVFNLVSSSLYLSPYNWRDNVDRTFWSWGQDGLLIQYDMNAGKAQFSCCTITASITCFDSSSLDPNRLAIGVRDGTIRVWDLSLPHYKIIAMHKFQQKVTQKVSSIAWHPLKEMILGFGTEEGRVGFLDVGSKKSTVFPHYFHKEVYKVEWGPIKAETSNLGLYVVAEGKLAIYDINLPHEDPTELELPEQMYVYKFAWKPDFSLLLLSGKDGSVVILKTDLVALTTIYLSEKGFNAIVWHPDAFIDNSEVSPRCSWFAATTSKGFLVYDCTAILQNGSVNENFMENIIGIFEGHLKPTLSLAWCPFDGNKIVSTAADGLSHVWDVLSKTTIATFVDPYICHNPAVTWSPVDSNLIIIGGDKLITLWNVSKNPPKVDEEFMETRKRLLTKTSKPDHEKTEKSKIKVDIPQHKNYSRNCIVPPFYVSSDENVTAQVANMRKVMLREHETDNKSTANSLDPFQLFAKNEEVSQLLTANYEQQKKEGKHKCCELISLWKGNINECIQDAINENRVTPMIITLAPMVSLRLWQEACESYSRKLSESVNSNPLDTATYFLACHKIEEAINCLCEGLMFKEALALAKHRLPESSDIIVKVTEKWAEHCINNGNFETAALCYISMKQYVSAAKVLSRRNNKEFLEFAAELAEKEGNKELYNSINFKYNELKTDKSPSSNTTEQELLSRADILLDKSNGDKLGVDLHLDEKNKNESNDTSSSTGKSIDNFLLSLPEQ